MHTHIDNLTFVLINQPCAIKAVVMLLQFFSLHQKLPPPPPGSTSSSFFKGTTAALSSSSSLFDYYNGINNKHRRRTTTNLPLHASKKKDSKFELDRDKAREALKQLDQQIQNLSENESAPPKQRNSAPVLEMDPITKDMMKNTPPDFSDSFFVYSAVSLLMLTMLYNMIFLTIIKPAIDGPVEQEFSFLTSTTNNTTIKEAPNPSGFQQSTPPTVSSEE